MGVGRGGWVFLPASGVLELGVLPRETDCVGQNNLLESGPVAARVKNSLRVLSESWIVRLLVKL